MCSNLTVDSTAQNSKIFEIEAVKNLQSQQLLFNFEKNYFADFDDTWCVQKSLHGKFGFEN